MKTNERYWLIDESLGYRESESPVSGNRPCTGLEPDLTDWDGCPVNAGTRNRDRFVGLTNMWEIAVDRERLLPHYTD